MKLAELLNPMEESSVNMDELARVMVDRVEVEPWEASFRRTDENDVLVVETQVETTSAARRLMMLGTKNLPQQSALYSTQVSQSGSLSMCSPVLFPAHSSRFHMSPLAHKITSSLPVWTTCVALPMQPKARLAPAAPATSPLKRRLSSISDSGICTLHGITMTPQHSSCDRTNQDAAVSQVQHPDHCSVMGCLRRPSQQYQGKCAVHKGMKLCQIEGCFRPVQSRGCCKSHGGGARCKHPDCTKGAISRGRCRTHGGGTRCAVLECPKWAQRFGCCVRHSKTVSLKPKLL